MKTIIKILIFTTLLISNIGYSNTQIGTYYYKVSEGETIERILRNKLKIGTEILDSQRYLEKIIRWDSLSRKDEIVLQNTILYIELPKAIMIREKILTLQDLRISDEILKQKNYLNKIIAWNALENATSPIGPGKTLYIELPLEAGINLKSLTYSSLKENNNKPDNALGSQVELQNDDRLERNIASTVSEEPVKPEPEVVPEAEAPRPQIATQELIAKKEDFKNLKTIKKALSFKGVFFSCLRENSRQLQLLHLLKCK